MAKKENTPQAPMSASVEVMKHLLHEDNLDDIRTFNSLRNKEWVARSRPIHKNTDTNQSI
jgi:hypothetical protein